MLTLIRKTVPIIIGTYLHYQNKKLKTALKTTPEITNYPRLVSLKKEAMNGARKAC